ncbi:ABC transporter permease [Streptosporangium sp. NPDC051022]|uniref:ABC transporter permease n=1 Tax=Streptosporangium sp. NPDC051022 TaxID=3155752 RepID=UPI0034278310
MTDPLNAPTKARPGTRVHAILARMARQPYGMCGLAALLLIIVGAVVVPVLSPYSSTAQDLHATLLTPSARHWFGTDHLGRDLFVRVFEAARMTLFIGLGAALLGSLTGVTIGAVSGYLGGRWDFVIQRCTDALLSLPSMLLALALIAGLGSGVRNVIVAVGLGSVPEFVRLARSQTLTLRESGFVEAAHALGVSRPVILARHILPHLAPLAVVQATTQLGGAILTAAGLGFLGLGVPSDIPEWGAMAAEGRDLVFSDPLIVAVPGIAISLAVLAFNLLGDALRDALDPRLRHD